MKTKFAVTTAYGTFTRSTEHGYTHLVITRGDLPSVIGNRFASQSLTDKENVAEYSEAASFGLAMGKANVSTDRTGKLVASDIHGFDDPAYPHVCFHAVSDYESWAAEAQARIDSAPARLAQALADNEVAPYTCSGWRSSLSGAQALAKMQVKFGRRDVRIISVLTGKEV